jgi:hypothetical protein
VVGAGLLDLSFRFQVSIPQTIPASKSTSTP